MIRLLDTRRLGGATMKVKNNRRGRKNYGVVRYRYSKEKMLTKLKANRKELMKCEKREKWKKASVKLHKCEERNVGN